jgi:hypothetical protein
MRFNSAFKGLKTVNDYQIHRERCFTTKRLDSQDDLVYKYVVLQAIEYSEH